MKPADVAKRYGVAVQKVLAWIASGELRAVNVATSARGARPRWSIQPDDLDAFEATRRTQPAPAKPPRRKRNDSIDPRVAEMIASFSK